MNPLFQIISREAAQRGVLSFARFMELALYCPVHGYYETKKDNPGRQGDFYTSVGVGELFGAHCQLRPKGQGQKGQGQQGQEQDCNQQAGVRQGTGIREQWPVYKYL